MKVCNLCKISKPLVDFYKHKNTKDGRQSKCKECDKSLHKKYLDNNPKYSSNYWLSHREKMDEQKINWLNVNRKRANKYQRDYRVKNLEKVKSYQNTYYKNKYINDIEYKLKSIVRSRINSGVKNFKKTDKTLTYLGCKISYYRFFLEELFVKGMDWGNYGEVWEIDHIIPLSKGGSFHYTNTQPLFKTSEIALSLGHNEYIGNRNKGCK